VYQGCGSGCPTWRGSSASFLSISPIDHGRIAKELDGSRDSPEIDPVSETILAKVARRFEDLIRFVEGYAALFCSHPNLINQFSMTPRGTFSLPRNRRFSRSVLAFLPICLSVYGRELQEILDQLVRRIPRQYGYSRISRPVP
jgi:hypothetical protein